MGFYKRISRSFTKNILVKATDTEAIQKFMEESPDSDYYDSIYLYDEKHKAQYDKTKSLAGITDVQTNRIIFDLDSKTDLEKARKDAILLASRLLSEGIPEETIQISTSGNKGYHVELFTDQYFNRKEIENILNHYAGDLSTVDFKITDEQRIIRMPLTKHPATGLYKTPVTLFELEMHDSDSLKEAAAEVLPKHYSLINSYAVLTPPDRFTLLKNLNPIDKQKLEQIEISSDRPDFGRRPKHLSPAKFALQEGFIPDGQSHHAFMILASTYRSLGYNKELAYEMIKATDRLRSLRYGTKRTPKEEIWNNIIQSTFGVSWKGGTYSEQEDKLILQIKANFKIKEQEEFATKTVVSIQEVSDIFKDFAENIDSNTIKLGLPGFDEDIRVTTSTFVALLAAPGAGKTSTAYSILNYVSQNNESAIFFSMDMGSPLVYLRLIQRHKGLQSDSIYNAYKNNNISLINEYSDVLKEEYKNVKFCFRSGMTVEEIRNVVAAESSEGRCPKLIVLDYFSCISGPFQDQYANQAYIAHRLKDIGNEFNCCVWALVQPQKSKGDASYELNSYRAIKGSSTLEEQLSQAFSMHRPGYNPKDSTEDKYVSFTVLKNRMGMLGSYDYHWDGLTGRIRTLTAEEEYDLKQLRSRLEEARETTNDGF